MAEPSPFAQGWFDIDDDPRLRRASDLAKAGAWPNLKPLERPHPGWIETRKLPIGWGQVDQDPAMQEAARDLGDRNASWMTKLLALPTLVAGTFQGKQGKGRRGSQGKPLPENVGVPRAERAGVKERPQRLPEAERELDPTGLYSAILEHAKNMPHVGKEGWTPERWKKELFKREHVTQAEWEAMGIDRFIADYGTINGKKLITKEDFVAHARANRVPIERAMYAGEEPDVGHLTKWDHDIHNEGGVEIYSYIYETPNGERFFVEHDGDAGNVSVQHEATGQYIDVGGQINRQSLRHAEDAIHDFMRKQAAVPGAKGPLRFSDPQYSLDPANTRENVSYLGPGRRAREIEERMKANQPRLYDLQEQMRALDAAHPELHGLEAEHGVNSVLAQLEGALPGGPGERARRAAKSQEVLDANEALRQKRILRDSHSRLTDEQRRLTSELNDINSKRFRSGHFSGEPGYLWHTRTSDQMTPHDIFVRFGDEWQSDLGQRIADQGGVRDEAKIAALREQIVEAERAHTKALEDAKRWLPYGEMSNLAGGGHPGEVRGALMRWHNETKPGTKDNEGNSIIEAAFRHVNALDKAQDRLKLLDAELRTATAMPVGHSLVNDTPQWTKTLARQELVAAALANQDYALTTADIQNERYGKSTRDVHGVRWFPQSNELYYQRPLEPHHGGAPGQMMWYMHNRSVRDPKQLADTIGKDLADRLLAQPLGDSNRRYSLEGLGGIEVGGHGMRAMYGDPGTGKGFNPNVLDSELRRIAAQVGQPYQGAQTTRLRTPDRKIHWRPESVESGDYIEQGPFHYFPMTPEMREQIKKGLPTFSAAGVAPLVGAGLAGTMLSFAGDEDEERKRRALAPFAAAEGDIW